MTYHRLSSLFVALAALLVVGLVGCEKEEPPPEGARAFEECEVKQTESLCKACCDEKAAMDYTFGTEVEGDVPCRCIPVP